MILAVSSTKGGPGKTTLAACLADHWLAAGHSIALLDTDPNRNLMHWFEKRSLGAFAGAIAAAEPDEDAIIASAEALAARVDRLVIDVAGVGSRALLYAAGIADAVLIPAQPSEDDLVEAVNTTRLVANAARLARRPIPARVVLNRVNSRAGVFRHSLEQLGAVPVPLCRTTLGNRTVFQKARFLGATPLRFEPLGAGAAEVAALAGELDDMMTEVAPGDAGGGGG